jgi:2,3-bisphosphoglycerate-independent phosphoglycerate mutase
MQSKKIILVIMDGWGLGPVKSSDAIQAARTPFVSSLYTKYPNTTLITCGEAVGLPDGQMGNSEVGHLNLGAGRIVYQELQRINVAIRSGEFAKNETLLQALRHAKANNKKLHLLGLVSDGGVHSHTSHLAAITSLCKAEGVENVLVHAFTDGRDTDPKSGLGYLTALQAHLQQSTGTIATITGRYYAMDRDKRWERVKLAYNALVNGTGEQAADMLAAVQQSYDNGVTDEFIKPIINSAAGDVTIKDGDVVICFNFRTDRCREITQVLTQTDMPDAGMHKLNLHYTTMTEYDKTFAGVNVVFNNDDLTNTLGDVLAQQGKTQIRIAETEKYPHVTFFFSGGRETPFEGEQRIMTPSPKVATYDLQPEMSAVELTESLLPEIQKGTVDFICLNYANADMVGHTGVWEAVIKAVETVDTCVGRVVTAGLENGYTIF